MSLLKDNDAKCKPGEGFSGKYDAFYNLETREWLSKQCGDDNCEFCTGRPDKFLDIDRSV